MAEDAMNLITARHETTATPQIALRAMSLLPPEQLAELYHAKCLEHHVKPNNTFLRSMAADPSVLNFSNSYFGERGMRAIAPTLAYAPVIVLDLRSTGLTSDDAASLYEALLDHPTLTALDVRRNALSLPTARRLLGLATQSKRLTILNVDDDAPKAAIIRNRCHANANHTVRTNACVSCGKLMDFAAGRGAEGELLGHIMGRAPPTLPLVAFDLTWRALLGNVEVNDGALFLCSHACILRLGDDLETAWALVDVDPARRPTLPQPRNAVLKRCLTQLRPMAEAPTWSPNGAVWEHCGVCGAHAPVLSDTRAEVIRILRRDVGSALAAGGVVRPTAFVRLIELMARHSSLRACSVKCVRMLIRFGLLGLGGVVRPRPTSEEVLLDSVFPDTTLPSPGTDFTVVDLTAACSHYLPEEDSVCAAAVASTVADIDGVQMDPYYLFAAGRKRTPSAAFGMDLQAACRAVVEDGCLPAAAAPFPPGSSRQTYANWASWEQQPGFKALRMQARAHRKQQFFRIPRPSAAGRDLFAALVAALWTFRAQRRCLVAAVKWRLEWTHCRGGVIPSDTFKGGFHTAVKVLGLCHLADQVPRLILQPMFGDRVGRSGFFFAPATVVDRNFKFGAYIFVEPGAASALQRAPTGTPLRSVEPLVAALLSQRNAVTAILDFLARPRVVPGRQVAELRHALRDLPVALRSVTFSATAAPPSREWRSQQDYFRRLYSGVAELQLAFLWAAVFGGSPAAGWLLRVATGQDAPLVPVRTSAFEDSGPVPLPVHGPLGQGPASVPSGAAGGRRSVFNFAEPGCTDGAGPLRLPRRRSVLGWVVPESNRKSAGELRGLSRQLQGKQWHCIPLHQAAALGGPSARSTPTGSRPSSRTSVTASPPTLLLVFIQGCMGVYDREQAHMSVSLRPLSQVTAFAQFPFGNGFDACCACSHRAPNVVYFFAGDHWAEWDAARGTTLSGPHATAEHPLFKSLPSQYHAPQSVFDIPGKPQLIFVAADHKYAVFDLDRGTWCEYEFAEAAGGPLDPVASVLPQPPMTVLPPHSGLKTPFPCAVGHCGRVVPVDISVDCPRRPAAEFQMEVEEGFASATLPGICPNIALELLQCTLLGSAATLDALTQTVSPSVVSAMSLFTLAEATPPEIASPTEPLQIYANSGLLEASVAAELLSPPPSTMGLVLDAAPAALSAVEGPLDIEFDFGSAPQCRFGYVQVVTAGCGGRQFPATVSMSLDGVGFKEVAVSTVSTEVFDLCWGPVQSARFWRLSFRNAPPQFCVARVLWFNVSWRTDAPAFRLTADSKVPSAAVFVEAPKIVSPPRNLLREVSTVPVFAVLPHKADWTFPHCIIPLLAPARTALFLSGTSFVEYDPLRCSVVGGVTHTLAHHPAFASLPFPFSTGIDAAFYPDPRVSGNVVLLSQMLAIEWVLDEGRAASPVHRAADSVWLSGLPAPFDLRIDAAVNVWDRPGQLLLFSGGLTLTWSIPGRHLIDPPAPRQKRPAVHCDDFTGPLLSATAFPNAPASLWLFDGARFAVVEARSDRHVAHTPTAATLVASRQFHALGHFLHWGEVARDVVLTYDFDEDHPALVGLTLHCAADGTGTHSSTTWVVESSHDAHEWTRVALHTQSAPVSTSLWDVGAVGARYWRLRLDQYPEHRTLTFSQSRFHVLPSAPCGVAPVELLTNGHLERAPFLPDSTVGFDRVLPSRHGAILFDYGPGEAAPELVSVSFEASRPPAASDRWGIFFSDDNAAWTAIAAWRVHTTRVSLHWSPTGQHRYWKLALLNPQEEPTPSYGPFAFEEYTGLSLVTPIPEEFPAALSIITSAASRAGTAAVTVPASRGESVLVDCKAAPQAFVGITVTAEHSVSVFSTTFDVQYSDDALDWFSVGTVVVSREAGTAVWENEGTYRYWRLVVTQHYGTRHVHLRSMEFLTGGPALYVRQRRHLVLSDGVFRHRQGAQCDFVAVKAKLQPQAVVVAERLDLDAVWIPVAVLHNSGDTASVATASWSSGGYSEAWRLRPLVSPQSTPEPTPPQAVTFKMPDSRPSSRTEPRADAPPPFEETQWYSLCGTASHPLVLTKSRCAVRLTGFEWLGAADPALLSPLDFQPLHTQPVLRSVTPSSVLKSNSSVQMVGNDGCSVMCSFDRPAVFCGVQLRLCGPVDRYANIVAITAEVLNDGSDTSALLATPLSHRLLCGDTVEALHWPTTPAAVSRRWRVRFTSGRHVPPTLEIAAIRWLFVQGAVTAVGEQATATSVSNTLAQLARDNGPDRLLESGLQSAVTMRHAARTNIDGLIPSEDQPSDVLAATLSRFLRQQKLLQKALTKSLKEQQRELPRGRPLVVDTLRLLGLPGPVPAPVERLAGLVAAPVLVSELKFVKDTGSWPFPKTDYKGQLAQPFMGLSSCSVGASLRWRLDRRCLRDSGAAAPVSAVDGRTTVACMTVDIVLKDWPPDLVFPTLSPVLALMGAVGQPVIVAFASGSLEFGPGRPMPLPNTTAPFSGRQPFSLHYGMNVVFEWQPGNCHHPATSCVQDLVRNAPEKTSVATTAVFTAADSKATGGVLRFRLPAHSDLGFPTILRAEALVFEMLFGAAAGAPRLAFAAVDSTFSLPGGETLPASILGSVSLGPNPRVLLEGSAGTTRWPEPDNLHRAVLENVSFSAVSRLVDGDLVPQSFTLSGTLLLLDTALALPCTAAVPLELGGSVVLRPTLTPTSLADLLAVCGGLVSTEYVTAPWLAACDVRVSGSLAVSSASGERVVSGDGAVQFRGCRGEATLEASIDELSVTARFSDLQLGAYHVTPFAERPVLLEFSASRDALPVLRIEGGMAVLTQDTVSCVIEMNASGVRIESRADFVSVVARTPTVDHVVHDAAVEFGLTQLDGPLRESLLGAPMLSALVGAGVPFGFDLHAVSVVGCDVARRSLVLQLRGVLFGAAFVVPVTVRDLVHSSSFVRDLASEVAVRIIEACRGAIAPLVDEFVIAPQQTQEHEPPQSTFAAKWDAELHGCVRFSTQDTVDAR